MKSLKRYVALILVLLMSVMAFASCNFGGEPEEPAESEDTGNIDDTNDTSDTNDTNDTSDTNDTDDTNETNGGSTQSDGIYIVTDSLLKYGEVMTDAVNYLGKAVKAAYGETAKKREDTVFEINSNNYTIIVGDTLLKESNQLPSNLKINDYAYKVLNEKLVVINGGSAAAIKEGVVRFCKDVLTYNGSKASTKNPTWTAGTKYTYNAKYSTTKLAKINGISIANAKIVIRNDKDVDYAEQLVRTLGQHNGYSVPIITRKAIKTTDKALIYLGTLNKETSSAVSATYEGYRVAVKNLDASYAAGISGGKVKKDDGSTVDYYKQAVEDFIKNIKTNTESSNVEITLPVESFHFLDYTYYLMNGNSKVWTLSSSSFQKLEDGMTYKVNNYSDITGANHRVYVLTVDLDKFEFYLGTPSAGNTYQTLAGQMQNAVSQNVDIVAGINGDLFVNGQARGYAVKDGQLLSRGYVYPDGSDYINRPCLVLTKSGEYRIDDTAAHLNVADIDMAVGIDYKLVSGGLPIAIPSAGDENQKFSLHPRTLVGLTFNNELMLVVVDGRQTHSTGSTLENAAELMASLGCETAGSLDGGGSSEMVIINNGNYETKNSPSDGYHRTTVNSVLVARKH